MGTLLQDGFYSVKPLNPRDPKTGDYQRELIPKRANEIARYVLKSLQKKSFFMPTSILLATEEQVDHDEEKGTISFDVEKIGPFSVVDGQHRLGGMREAIEILSANPKKYKRVTEEDILNIELPVLIADGFRKKWQKGQFLIVNTTQKNIDKNLVFEINAEFASESDDEIVLPDQTMRAISDGKTTEAKSVLEYLNSEGSPWHNRILEVHGKKQKGKRMFKKSSFAGVLKKYVLNDDQLAENPEELRKFYLNYWKAVASFLTPPEGKNVDTLYLINGAGVFSAFFNDLFGYLHDRSMDYTADNFEKYLRKVFEYFEDERDIGNWEFWETGSTGGRMNKAEYPKIRNSLRRALRDVRTAESN